MFGRARGLARERPAAAAAAGLAAAIVLAGIVALASPGGDSDDEHSVPVPVARSPTRRIVNAEAGVLIVRPRGWDATARGRAVFLRARGRGVTATVRILAPPGGQSQRKVFADGTELVRSTLRDVRFLPGQTGNVGGRQARVARYRARTPRGIEIIGALAAVRGRTQSYLVQLLSRVGDPERVRAEAALQTLRLTK